jgi:hypothetical protein
MPQMASWPLPMQSPEVYIDLSRECSILAGLGLLFAKDEV